jgi:hypothetical protein
MEPRLSKGIGAIGKVLLAARESKRPRALFARALAVFEAVVVMARRSTVEMRHGFG